MPGANGIYWWASESSHVLVQSSEHLACVHVNWAHRQAKQNTKSDLLETAVVKTLSRFDEEQKRMWSLFNTTYAEITLYLP